MKQRGSICNEIENRFAIPHSNSFGSSFDNVSLRNPLRKFSRKSKCHCADTSAHVRFKIDGQEIIAQNAHKVEWFRKNDSLDTDAQ